MIKNILAAAALALLALTCATAQTPPTGKVTWAVDGRPPLDFAPKTAVGLYVKAQNSYALMFFADTLTLQESNYWLARQARVFGGKFQGQAFQSDAAMNTRVNALAARSVMLWGTLNSQSKHAKEAALPAEHLAKDLIGVMVCIGHNCGYHSGGVHSEEYAAQVKSLRIPTPSGAASGLTAALDGSIDKLDGKTIVLKGELPFYVVHE